MTNFATLAILCLMIISSFSCSNRPETESQKSKFPKTIKLDLSSFVTDPLRMSEIVDKIEYIPLQTSDSSLLSYFNEFYVTKDNFFINIGPKVFVFDKAGKFSGELFNVGSGPGETSAERIAVNEKDRLVYVLDSRSKIIKTFNFERKLINASNRINLPEHFTWSIAYFNKNLLVATAQRPNAKFLYSIYDLNLDTIKIIYTNTRDYRESHRNFTKNPITVWNYHYQIKDSIVLLKERFCDTIYSVDRNLNKTPWYIIDLGQYKCTWEEWRDNYMFLDPRVSQTSIASGYYLQSFVESDAFMFMVFKSNQNPLLFAVYNKETNSVKVFQNEKTDNRNAPIYLDNDLDFLIDFAPMNRMGYMVYYDNCLFSIIEAGEFAKNIKGASEDLFRSNKYLKELKPIFSQIDEYDNPIIIKIHLKKQ